MKFKAKHLSLNVKSQPTIPLLSVQPPSGYYFISVTVSASSSPWPTEDERGRAVNCSKPAKRVPESADPYNAIFWYAILNMKRHFWKDVQHNRLGKKENLLNPTKETWRKQENMLSSMVIILMSIMVYFPIQTHPTLAHKKVITRNK